MNIINLTPHPVTIVRPGCEPLTYAPANPAAIPRALETTRSDTGCWRLAVTGDTQDAYENAVTMMQSGLVENRQYVGVEGLPDLTPDELAFGVRQFRIVSIVTAIGALAAGRAIVDLLVPCGQVRDPAGRIIGATALAPATSLLSPMAEALGAR